MLNSSIIRISIESVLENEPNRAIATVTSELTLNETSINDAGNDYSCRASIAAIPGEDSEMFELFVRGKFVS